MKNSLQKIISFNFEDKFSGLKEKWTGFVNAHPELVCLALLAVACLLFLFFGLGSYPLMDVDETRYAIMSRDLMHSFDWNSLMLNGVPFLEKPPLYFWMVGSSIKLFGVFSPLAVRFPIALITSFLVFFTYYVGKRVISRKFGVISALVLISSIFFLILSHVAIIDMVLTVFMTSAIYCAFLTHFCEEKNKKYYWWYFYLFIGLGFLAKGILALAIPAVVIFLYNLATKTVKDIFKPINFIPGIIIFLVMIMPWHLIMYQQYGFQFVKEYFLIHHFGRFMGSEYIGRERPFLYFVPVFLLGFLPWTFFFIAFLCDGFKKLVAKFKATEGAIKDKIFALFETTTNEQQLILFAMINILVIFFVFSTSSTKLPTYILPIFPAASFLVGYYWWIGDEKGEHEKSIYNLTLLFSSIFILAAAVATIAYYLLPTEIEFKLRGFHYIIILAFNLLAIFLILRLKTKRALSIFSGYVLTMLFIIILAVANIFSFVYSTGENEIVQYSKYVTDLTNPSQLVTFDFAVKPSVMIEYQNRVNFLTDPDFKALDKILAYKGGRTFVIVKNKNFIGNDNYRKEIEKRLKLIQKGERYSLYVNVANKKI